MSKETLTRGEAQIVIKDLKTELDAIRDKIKSRGLLPTAADELKKREVKIQEKLSEILKKGGLITEEDYNEAYNLLKAKTEKEFIILNKKRKQTMLLVGLLIVGIVGFFAYKKFTKK